MFPLLMIGQAISQIPRAIALPYAGRLANLMLKSNEIARGVAIGTSGQTLGLGLGYLLPAIIVTNRYVANQYVTNMPEQYSIQINISSSFENSVEGMDQTDYLSLNKELFWLNLSVAISSLVILIGMLCLYKHDPVPLNYAERHRSSSIGEIKRLSRCNQMKDFFKMYTSIFSNMNFILLLTSFMLIHG